MAGVKNRFIKPWIEEDDAFTRKVKCRSHIICYARQSELVFDSFKRGPRCSSVRWINFFNLPRVSDKYNVPRLKIIGDG